MAFVVRTLGTEPDPAKRLRQKQGQKLREYRVKFRRYSLRQLAELMSQQDGITVTPQAIGMWERGKMTPRPHHQVAICRALDVMPSAIFGLDQEVA